jgi:DMSO/TMAO reductase YedYZ heme-binding membrane subunit
MISDYLHLTKRFGIIAASQLPIHYLLAMPHPYSPFQLLRKDSYRLNMSIHQVTGRIILMFIAAHVLLYSICFARMNIFWQSVRQPKILVGLISAGILCTLGITSTPFFRRRHYRWFYKVHVTGSIVILPLLFLHVEHLRIYLLESEVVVVMNVVLRVFSSREL